MRETETDEVLVQGRWWDVHWVIRPLLLSHNMGPRFLCLLKGQWISDHTEQGAYVTCVSAADHWRQLNWTAAVTALKASEKEINKDMMGIFFKHWKGKLFVFFFNYTIRPNQSMLTNWTNRHCWTLVQSPKISEGLKPRKAASPVITLHRPALPCPVFVLFSPIGQIIIQPALLGLSYSLGRTELFVFCDRMNVSVG